MKNINKRAILGNIKNSYKEKSVKIDIGVKNVFGKRILDKEIIEVDKIKNLEINLKE